MKISALLINHNSKGTILKSIQSLLEQECSLDAIVVVDNGSTDGGVDQIRETFPQAKVIELGENRGLSRARNAGLTHIHSELVLLVDDDVYLAAGSLKKMILALQETGAAVVCPRIVLHPENEVLQCDGAEIHFAGTLALRHAYDSVSTHPPVRCMTGGFIGACLLFDRRVLGRVGGFDEEYFFYFEDLELSYRLRALGYTICCEENARALHERGAGTENLSFRGTGSYPARRVYLNLRHRWLTILIHYQARTLLLLSPALVLYESAAFVESLRRGWGALWFKALFSLLGQLKEIHSKRRKWKALRKISDGSILNGGSLPFATGFAKNKGTAGLIQRLDQLLNIYWNLAKRWL